MPATEVIAEWLAGGRQLDESGERMEAAYARVLLPRLARKAGVKKRVHAHGLRHTDAFELANEGVAIHVI